MPLLNNHSPSQKTTLDARGEFSHIQKKESHQDVKWKRISWKPVITPQLFPSWILQGHNNTKLLLRDSYPWKLLKHVILLIIYSQIQNNFWKILLRANAWNPGQIDSSFTLYCFLSLCPSCLLLLQFISSPQHATC